MLMKITSNFSRFVREFIASSKSHIKSAGAGVSAGFVSDDNNYQKLLGMCYVAA